MMISTAKQVPSVYTDESRDFQLLEHLFDAVANASRAGIDGMTQMNGKHEDSRFLKLSEYTLGFSQRHEATDNSRKLLCASFKDIVRNKGSKTAVDMAVNMLMRSQNIHEEYSVAVVNVDDHGNVFYSIRISVPYSLTDISMLEDLFDYILPAGYVYSIYRQKSISVEESTLVPIAMSETGKSLTDAENSDMSSKLDSVPVPTASAEVVHSGDMNTTTVVGSVKNKN